MGIADALLPEFDHELANTRKTLERIPEAKFDWKPHEKSMSFRGLATHLANMLHWAAITIREDRFDVAPSGGEPMRQEPVDSPAAALELFDRNVAAAREALAGATDAHLLAPWSLLKGGQPILTQPRIAFIRGMILNHLIHHRAQLTVYLRQNDIPVPALYGRSADESM